VSLSFHHQYLWHVLCFVLLVAVHLFFSRAATAPAAMFDEFIYLVLGPYFSGTAAIPNMHGAAFGAFGYGLLIAPAFRMAESFFEQDPRNPHHRTNFTLAGFQKLAAPHGVKLLERLGSDPVVQSTGSAAQIKLCHVRARFPEP
jgi:hypothetical protein